MSFAFRITLAMALLAALTAAAVGVLTYFGLRRTFEPIELATLGSHTEAIAEKFESGLANARSDLLSLRGAAVVRGFVRAQANGGVDPETGLSTEAWLDQTGMTFAALAVNRPSYVQVRIIGVSNDGLELVRVDRARAGSDVRVVPSDELQSKGERPYFVQGMRERDGGVYVSPIELNQEQGEVEQPHRPVLRVATPLIPPGGLAVGMLVINVDLTAELARLAEAATPGGRIFLVNADGDFLVHPDPARVFGFDLGARHRIQDEYPKLAGMLDTESEEVCTLPGIDGESFGVAVRNLAPAGGRRVTLIEVLPEARLLAAVQPIGRIALFVGLGAALGAVVIAVLLARTMTRPLVRMTEAVSGMTTHGPTAPVAAPGELGILARAFEEMRLQVQEKTKALKREVAERREAEQAAERHAAGARLLSSIVESTDDAIITKDLEGTITSWNQGAERLFGYTAGEAVGQNINLIVPPERREEEAGILDRVGRGESVKHFETVRVAKSGRKLDISLTISPMRSPDGKVIGASKISRDITSRRRAEKTFRLAVESSPSGMVLVDQNGVITLLNAEAERLFGYRRDELIGQPVEVLVPERFRGAHPGFLKEFVAHPESRPMGAGRELYGLRKDGTEFPVEIGLNPVEGPDGLQIIAAVTDISARKSAEEQFHLAVEASPNGMVVVDQVGVITLVNAETERLFGYPRDELVGQSVDVLVPERFRAAHPGYLKSFVTDPEARPMGAGRELYGRRKDGTEFSVEIGLNPVRTRGRLQIIASITDISARKQAEAALRESKERYQAIIDTALDGVVVMDHRGRIAGMNEAAERIFGHRETEVGGKLLADVMIPPALREQHRRGLEHYLATGDGPVLGRRIEMNGLRKDGSEVPLELSICRMPGAGDPMFTAFVRDITERKQAEARFRLAVDASPSGMVLVNRDGIIELINSETERLFGYARDDLIGQPVEILLPERFRGAHPDLLKKFVAHPEARPMGGDRELFGLRKDGTEFPVEIGLNPVESHDGLHVIAAITDISARKQAEEKFRLAVDASPSGMVLVDRKGIIELINTESERLFGYAREELVGQPVDTLLPERFRSAHPGHVSNFVARPEARPMGGGRELFGLRKDGTEFPVEIGLNPVESHDGLRVIAAITDITARKAAEAALRDSERRFREIADSLPQLVWTCNPDGRCDYLSMRWLEYTGAPEGEQLGSGWLEYIHPADRDPLVAAWTAATMEGTSLRTEFRVRRYDGVYRWFDTRAVPLRNPDGRIVKWFGSNTDVTEQREAAKALERHAVELRRSNEELEQFAYVASHDLQEPLRMVASYTELLGERYQGKLDEKADKFIHYAVDGARRMQRLINDLLAYSRVGRSPPKKERVDVAAVVARVLRSMDVRVSEANASIAVHSLPVVQGDEGLIGQVFQNLLSNALKFRSKNRPEIRIEVKSSDTMHEFCVADNGIGIDMSQANRLFQMFQRLNERGKYEGSGIGLAIVKKIVGMHGGQVWLDSQPGRGSVFHFTLPRQPEENAT